MENVVLNMTLGSMIQYTVTATDNNGDDLSMKVDGLPAGATTTRTGNSLTFSWLVNSTEPVCIWRQFTVSTHQPMKLFMVDLTVLTYLAVLLVMVNVQW